MQKNSTAIWVVAGALISQDGQVLMHRRHRQAVHGGLWEFPGGKMEDGESPESTLVRELAEELGVIVNDGDLSPVSFTSGRTAGPDAGRPLVILLYTCRRWVGDPQCLEGEAIDWFDVGDLSSLAMPPLDYPLAERLADAIAADRV